MRVAAWRLAASLGAWLLGACTAPAKLQYLPPEQPEMATPATAKPGWLFAKQGVVAAHPLAADAGAQVLRAGGNAVDAAVAVQLVLGLVEPQSSGIGGGAFLVLWDGTQVQTWDGRETAPADVDAHLFVGADGKPMPLQQAVVGGLSVGTPGVVRMLAAAHREHGRLRWQSLFDPAISLAESGFRIGPRLAAQIAGDPFLRDDPVARTLYYDDAGEPVPAGTLLRNPDYAAVLRRLAAEGPDALYRGPLAERIVAAVRSRPARPGRLSLQDLADYQPKKRPPVCFDWGTARLCGSGPPASGTLAIGQILALSALASPAAVPTFVEGLPTAAFLHAYTEASRLAFADRAAYVGDPDFVSPPGGRWDTLLAPTYLVGRSRLIGPRSMKRAEPGEPAAGAGIGPPRSSSADTASEVPATSHISIVDADGRAVSMTTSIEAQFGSRVMVNSGSGLAGGFLLNNQLTDFSYTAAAGDGPVPNRIEPRKRPRSSMSPMVGYDVPTKRLFLVTGSPGGPPLIHYTAKTIVAAMVWDLDAQQAVSLPNFGSLNGPTLLEGGGFPASTVDTLKSWGHEIAEQPLPSGANLLLRRPNGWSAGADPRRDGWAAGD